MDGWGRQERRWGGGGVCGKGRERGGAQQLGKPNIFVPLSPPPPIASSYTHTETADKERERERKHRPLALRHRLHALYTSGLRHILSWVLGADRREAHHSLIATIQTTTATTPHTITLTMKKNELPPDLLAPPLSISLPTFL